MAGQGGRVGKHTTLWLAFLAGLAGLVLGHGRPTPGAQAVGSPLPIGLTVGSRALAQHCPAGAAKSCDAAQRDARGCCPVVAKPKPKARKRARKQKATPKSKPRVSHGWGGVPPCAAGTAQGADTAGHCCWPAQYWQPSKGRCQGAPRCPAGRLPKANGDCACAEGRVSSVDTGGHCCWPGQVWLGSRQACVGTPRCPRGFVAQGEQCESADRVKERQREADARARLEAERQAAKRAAQPVTVSVKANIHGANIFIDRRHVGTTVAGSAVHLQVPVDSSLIQIAHTGYQTVQYRLDLAPGRGAMVDAVLVSDGQAAARASASGMVKIPGGRFTMGSGRRGEADEKPSHVVEVPTFYMDRSEVTVAAYAECVEARRCTARRTSSSYSNWGQSSRAKHPINDVSWKDADAYCKWAGKRLPSEAEWEYAARSAGEDVVYPWGNALASCSYAVMEGEDSYGCDERRTWPVCSKKKGHTKQGLCDMAGNVWEWVADEYHSTYRGAPTDGSAWVTSERPKEYVNRGGCWNVGDPRKLRVTERSGNGRSSRGVNIGFRCALSGP